MRQRVCVIDGDRIRYGAHQQAGMTALVRIPTGNPEESEGDMVREVLISRKCRESVVECVCDGRNSAGLS